jgi:sugar-specific transcriptional regulator TrmB
VLQPLGISTEAEAVYLALGQLDTASASELTGLTDYNGERLAAALDQLRSLGLATGSSHGVWRALPLLDVVEQLRTQRLSELERSMAAAESVANHLLAQGSSQAEGVTTVQGRDLVVAAHDDLVNSARRELCAFDKPPYAVERSDISEEGLRPTPEWRALDRGVALRCVYHPGFDHERLHEMALFAGKGEQGRTARVPMKLILVDAHVAMVPSMRSYNPGHELRASIVRNPLLVEALVFLFEAVWDSALPILRSFTGEPNPRRQMLVSMLMTGSTDTAIAKSLDVNVRSVRRWIAELMDEFGVRTRLQLGAALVRSGISGSDRPPAVTSPDVVSG